MALNIPPLDLEVRRNLHKPPPGYMPKIYGYGRVSHGKQLQSDSPQAQEDRIRRYVELRKGESDDPFHGAIWAGMHLEPKAQSAFKKSFTRRPMGKKLIQTMNPTDHLVIDKLDRMWRSAEDFHYLMRKFTEHGVRIHFVNFFGASLELSSVMGQYMLGTMALNAQLESWTISERISRARRARRLAGLHDGAGKVKFCRLVDGHGGRKKKIYDPSMRSLMAEIVTLAQSGATFSRIADILEERRCRQLGVEFSTSAFTKTPRKWRTRYVIDLYWAELAIRDAGEPDPNTVRWTDVIAAYKEKAGDSPRLRLHQLPTQPLPAGV